MNRARKRRKGQRLKLINNLIKQKDYVEHTIVNAYTKERHHGESFSLHILNKKLNVAIILYTHEKGYFNWGDVIQIQPEFRGMYSLIKVLRAREDLKGKDEYIFDPKIGDTVALYDDGKWSRFTPGVVIDKTNINNITIKIKSKELDLNNSILPAKRCSSHAFDGIANDELASYFRVGDFSWFLKENIHNNNHYDKEDIWI